jgi:hypothetical protein
MSPSISISPPSARARTHTHTSVQLKEELYDRSVTFNKQFLLSIRSDQSAIKFNIFIFCTVHGLFKEDLRSPDYSLWSLMIRNVLNNVLEDIWEMGVVA